MKPPYFELTSRCANISCTTDRFYTTRKRVQYVSTDGELKSTTHQVCPACRCWGYVESIREVSA